MVSTRQSSNNAKSAESYTLDVTSRNDTSYVTHITGKILRSGRSASSDSLLPSTSTKNEISVTNSLLIRQHRARNLLDLPNEILEKIFSYLEYKNIAYIRPVCRQIDRVCQAILNSAFQRFQYEMFNRFQSIRAKMPRRESARRNHPLACESDIIETLHMRLSLLQMTFGRHIERKSCCFFPGEILDEVNRILHYIKVTSKLARPYKVTDELFDLSTMAMKFFKENIEPSLPEIVYFGSDFVDFSFPRSTHWGKGYKSSESGTEISSIETQPICRSNIALRKRIKKIKQRRKRYNDQLIGMRRDLRACKSQIAEQQKQLLKLSTRLNEYEIKNEETNLFELSDDRNPQSRAIDFLSEVRMCKNSDVLVLGESKKENKLNDKVLSPDTKVLEPVNLPEVTKTKKLMALLVENTARSSETGSQNMKRKIVEEDSTDDRANKPIKIIKIRYESPKFPENSNYTCPELILLKKYVSEL